MAKQKERKELNKKGWVSSFTLKGLARVNDNSFKLDQKSTKSDWIFSTANFGVDCGEKNGTVYVHSMGGYGADRDNLVYVHGKDENGRDDFKNKYTIAWEDREDKTLLEDIGDMCFYEVAIERDVNGKLVYMKFLSQYDMIAYLQENLQDGMAVKVSGDLEYQMYQGNVTVQKEIRRVVLLQKAEPENFSAKFLQTILVDSDSKGDVDKEKDVYYIDGYVLEYFKEFNGYNLAHDEVSGAFVPLRKQFEYQINEGKEELAKKAVNYLFKPKKGVSKITFIGEFVEGGAELVKTTVDDLPDDIKELISIGILTEEEALIDCATGKNRERRMILLRPQIKNIKGENDEETSIPQIFTEEYDDEDLQLECLIPREDELPFDEDEENENEDDFDEIISADDDDDDDDLPDWLKDVE